MLKYIDMEPSRPADLTIVWLHGLGADGQDFVPLVPELGLPESLAVRFIFPHAPMLAVTLNQGYIMRAWYDIQSLNLEEGVDEAGIRRSVAAIEALLADLVAAGTPRERILLAGFSQGGLIALRAGLGGGCSGVLALSTYLPATVLAQVPPAAAALPVFLAHGRDDTVVPFALAEATRERLRALGHAVDWRAYPMGHTLCPPEIQDLRGWLLARGQALAAAAV